MIEDNRSRAEQSLNLAVRSIHDAAVSLACVPVNPQTANEICKAIELLNNVRRRERLNKSIDIAL